MTEKKEPHNKLMFFVVITFSDNDNLENANVFLVFSNNAYAKIIKIINLPRIDE